MYFLWTTKINCRRFSGRLSTNVMTLLLIQIHSETNIFLSTKVIWERGKRGFISYLSAWGSDRRVCSKILPNRKNEIYLWKMATKFKIYSGNTDRVKNQSDCRIFTVPSKKKKKWTYFMQTHPNLAREDSAKNSLPSSEFVLRMGQWTSFSL